MSNSGSLHTLTRINEVGLRVQQDIQRLHVVIEILKHSRALTQDAVSWEERPLLLQQQGHVVVRVARREQHSGKKSKQPWLSEESHGRVWSKALNNHC